MKGLIFISTMLLTAVSAAHASDHDEIQHYEGTEVTSLSQAYDLLETQTAAMQEAVAAEDWGVVHKLSYDLEEAMEFIEEHVEETQEALEEVHEASEEHDALEASEAFEEYRAYVTQLHAVK